MSDPGLDTRPPRFVGQRLRRREDRRLLTGAGRFLADLRVDGMLHAAVLRSTAAHAAISRLEVGAALAADGVVAIVTAADLHGNVGPFVEGARTEISPLLRSKVPMEVKSCPMPLLADGEVLWVGQPVAVVVAGDPYTAEDALERIEVDYEPLPVVADADAAVAEGAPVLHPELGDNVAASFAFETADVDAALAAAPMRLRERFVMGRTLGNAMETRGVLARWDAGRRTMEVWGTNARPHLVRDYIARMLDLEPEDVRFVAPDMGGSFGTGVFSEDILVPFLAMRLGRPVRWVEDRRENLANTRHARDQIHDLEVGYDADGRVLALRDRFLVDCGAYNPYAITVSYNAAAHLRGQFRIDAFAFQARNVLTNRAPVTPVRGAGRPEAVFAMDRVVDLIAAKLGLDAVEVRRRNLIPAEAMPYRMGMPYRDGIDITYDGGDYPGQLDRALELFGYKELRERQRELRERGRRIGIGVSSYVEGSGYGPHEGAIVRVATTGRVTVITGAKPHGQGLETTLAQVCADQLGVHPDQVTVRAGDTSLIQYGIGTFASRSAVTAGAAVGLAAIAVRHKALAIAAELLEADPADLDLADGRAYLKGAPERGCALAALAAAAVPGPRGRLAPGMAPGLVAERYFVPPTVTFASGTHVVAVEVDEDTGFVKLLRYLTVDDCGQML
ncbi:MAG TPA: xanthine dehydrogenase family protein molybdopterin-binding subunit, partial [Actinomycetota bacterium]|nr:xanthine dehydrogenase family protein molybdopterin-binding subunit [Actinomycetota bacterium]